MGRIVPNGAQAVDGVTGAVALTVSIAGRPRLPTGDFMAPPNHAQGRRDGRLAGMRGG